VVYDRRGDGVAATLAGLVASGEPVLVVTACAERRLRAFEGTLGGFALGSWDGLQRGRVRADEFAHVVALDPPLLAGHEQALRAAGDSRSTHLAWGGAELRFAHDVLEHDAASHQALRALYAELRAAPQGALEDVLRGPGRTAVHAGRLVRVLTELGLLEVSGDGEGWRLTQARHTQLERSAAFRAYAASLAEGRAWLTRATSQAA
jgi:single-stranded-DNA-specific exonuclease